MYKPMFPTKRNNNTFHKRSPIPQHALPLSPHAPCSPGKLKKIPSCRTKYDGHSSHKSTLCSQCPCPSDTRLQCHLIENSSQHPVFSNAIHPWISQKSVNWLKVVFLIIFFCIHIFQNFQYFVSSPRKHFYFPNLQQ